MLRRNETEAEYRLWGHLRNRLLNGYKFIRQAPLGPYVADFVCRERRLIIELDGSQHAESSHDIVRTRWLNANGYSVLRFWNHEVLQERQAVLDTIFAAVEGHLHERCEIARFYPAAVPPAESEMAPHETGGSLENTNKIKFEVPVYFHAATERNPRHFTKRR